MKGANRNGPRRTAAIWIMLLLAAMCAVVLWHFAATARASTAHLGGIVPLYEHRLGHA